MLPLFTSIKIVALISYAILAALTLRSGAERRVRTFFSIYLFGMLSWQAGSVLVNFTGDAGTALLLYDLMIAFSAAYTILFFPFTRALLGIDGQKVLTALAYTACVLQFATAIAGLQLKEVGLGRGGYWVPVYGGRLMYVLSVLSFLFWGCGFFNLVRGLSRATSPVQRNRLVYVLLGASVTIVGASTNLTSLRDYPVDISANLASALVIGYAVVRHRLLDIRVVLARSLFYSTLTASLIASYLGVVLALGSLLQQGRGASGPAYGIVATIVLAVIFLPLRNLLQALLDRIFFREKADYQKATQDFSRAINSQYDSDAILDLVGGTIARAVRPTFVSIALLDQGSGSYVLRKSLGAEGRAAPRLGPECLAAAGRRLRKEGKPLVRGETPGEFPGAAEAAASVFVPILLGDRLLGILSLGEKFSGTIYNDEDLRFLATIADQTATALEKSGTFREIRRRLSEQTLLFILSEKLRSSADFDVVLTSIVSVLRDFLNCEHCAIVSFDKSGKSSAYASDPTSRAAADICAELRGAGEASDAPVLAEAAREAIRGRESLTGPEREELGTFVYSPLKDGGEVVGMLALSSWTGGAPLDEREMELLRAIRALLSQGIVLYRTILDLMRVEAYNENILNSLNDMGDTLIILDLEGRVRMANRAACKLLEFTEAELAGGAMSGLVGEDGGFFTEEGFLELARGGSVSNREIYYRSKSGREIPVLLSASAMTGEDGRTREVVLVARDITEHRKAEEAAKSALLIQEIHHRIKNNLQVISSLLFLQASYVDDERIREMFRDSQNRVRSMALIHEKLYKSRRPSAIDFSEYIGDLARNLFTSYKLKPANVTLSIDGSDISLGMDTAVPCGLIVNELVSNSLKHAFPDGRSGEIRIALRRIPPGIRPGTEVWYDLSVSDDGIGFPEGTDFGSFGSMGLKVVSSLTHQLHGEIEAAGGRGTEFRIRFKEV